MTSAVTRLETVGSTNDWLLERAGVYDDGHWVIARRQTAGRGRRGRAWSDGAGNLMASVLVKPQADEREVQQLSFVAALALYDAILASCGVPNSAHAELVEAPHEPSTSSARAELAGWRDPGLSARLSLKWPNDLLLDGRKLSGILLERTGGPLVIGFGVNLHSAPEGLEPTPISLAMAGLTAPSPDTLLEVLVLAFDARRNEWRTQGFGVTRDHWLARATGLGGRIAARLGPETLTGRFDGLDEDGALSLRLDNGSLRAVHAGEVFAL